VELTAYRLPVYRKGQRRLGTQQDRSSLPGYTQTINTDIIRMLDMKGFPIEEKDKAIEFLKSA